MTINFLFFLFLVIFFERHWSVEGDLGWEVLSLSQVNTNIVSHKLLKWFHVREAAKIKNRYFLNDNAINAIPPSSPSSLMTVATFFKNKKKFKA